MTKSASPHTLYPFLHKDFEYQTKEKEKRDNQRRFRKGAQPPPPSEQTRILMAYFQRLGVGVKQDSSQTPTQPPHP